MRTSWRTPCVVAIVVLFAVAALAESSPDRSSKMSLQAKADLFYQNLLDRHLIDGLFTSHVELLPGGEVDHTTTGICDVAHAACWTGRYLAGVGYWYAVTKDSSVQQHGQLILDALARLHHMTGVPGLLARGYVKGHGPSYEERFHEAHQDEWHQGVRPYQDYRWRGDVSVDNYNGVLFGYAVYYDLAASEQQRRQIREEVRALLTHIVEHGMRIVDVDSQVTEWGRWLHDPSHFGKLPRGRMRQFSAVLALAALKVGEHITGEPRFARKYRELVRQYKIRDVENLPEIAYNPGISASDACMYLESLYNLCRLEQDKELVKNYTLLLRNLYRFFQGHGNTFFDFVYAAAVGDTSQIADGLQTLRLFPTDRVVKPVMLSLDPQWARYKGGVLPINVRPLDNEYEWKNDGKQLDGWLAERIVSLDLAPEDPVVRLVVSDQGQIYRSLDGGLHWENVSNGLNGASVRRAVFSGRRLRIVYAASDRGVYRSLDGGLTWELKNLGLRSRDVQTIFRLLSDPEVLVAVTNEGVYESLDRAEQWVDISAGLTSRENLKVTPLNAPVPTLLAVSRNVVFLRSGDGAWQQVAELEPRFLRVTSLAYDPHRAYTVYAATNEFGVLKSEDGGRTWQTLHWRYVFDQPVLSVAVAYHRPNTLYAARKDGVWVTYDGGKHWTKTTDGLDIPSADAVFTSPLEPLVWASTPAGLYASARPELGWRFANLRVIERHSPNRFEVGGVDYLMAYWMGRYYGFISPEEAARSPLGQ